MSAPCPLFGATVHAELRPDAPAGSLLARFRELLSSRGLLSAGLAHTTWDLVVSSEAGQMTESDRSAIVEWLAAEPALSHVMVTPVGDLRDDVGSVDRRPGDGRVGGAVRLPRG